MLGRRRDSFLLLLFLIRPLSFFLRGPSPSCLVLVLVVWRTSPVADTGRIEGRYGAKKRGGEWETRRIRGGRNWKKETRMDSIGLVLFDSIKIRGGGGEVCAHRLGMVGYNARSWIRFEQKGRRNRADIPRELTSTLPLALPPPAPPSSPSSLVQHGWELLSLPLSYDCSFLVLEFRPPVPPVIALSTAPSLPIPFFLLQARRREWNRPVLVFSATFSYSRPRLVVSIERRRSLVGYSARFMRRTPTYVNAGTQSREPIFEKLGSLQREYNRTYSLNYASRAILIFFYWQEYISCDHSMNHAKNICLIKPLFSPYITRYDI